MGTRLNKPQVVGIFIIYFQPHLFSLPPNTKDKRKRVRRRVKEKKYIRKNNVEHLGHMDKTEKNPSCQNQFFLLDAGR